MQETLTMLIEELPFQERLILSLRFEEELDPNTIAYVTGINYKEIQRVLRDVVGELLEKAQQ